MRSNEAAKQNKVTEARQSQPEQLGPQYVAPEQPGFAGGLGRLERMLRQPLAGAQRQAILQQIGRQYGNRAVQRVLAAAKAGQTVQRAIRDYSNHPTLAWADFTGAPDASSPNDASTFSGVTLDRANSAVLSTDQSQDDQGHTQYTVRYGIPTSNIHTHAIMNTNRSWVKAGRQSGTLLHHEQGHFEISHVFANKIKAALEDWANNNYGEATRSTRQAARNTAISQFNQMQPGQAFQNISQSGINTLGTVNYDTPTDGDYDRDTQHGSDASQQATWDTSIAGGLSNYTVP